MTTTQLKFGDVYKYTDQNKTVTAIYWGMTDDNYMFIPCHPVKKHFNGSPCTLTENEVQKHISAN
ncbi:hypothetical protein [Dysgonomonas reticulitermitis]